MSETPKDVVATAEAAAADFVRMNPSLASLIKIMEYQCAAVIMAERSRVNSLIEEKAQAFSGSRNPLAAELVAALDDLRLCVARGETVSTGGVHP